jgi:hypothetical protein
MLPNKIKKPVDISSKVCNSDKEYLSFGEKYSGFVVIWQRH